MLSERDTLYLAIVLVILCAFYYILLTVKCETTPITPKKYLLLAASIVAIIFAVFVTGVNYIAGGDSCTALFTVGVVAMIAIFVILLVRFYRP